MNILDRAYAFFAPKRAAERLYYRAVIDNAERQFDAAKLTRRTSGWRATGASANAETANGLDRIRFRARDLERNNSQAAGILRKLPAYIVGAGITARPADGDRARLAANWKQFVRTSDISGGTNFNAQMHLAARTIARDGEVLLSWQDLPDPMAPLALHVLESDHLDTTRTQELEGGNVIIQGVEFDANGRRVAYWIFDQHPGETVLISKKQIVSRRVDAARIDHVFDILRPGQARGVPWLAPVALRTRDVAEYEDAELVRKKIEACYSVFITRNNDDGTVPAGTQPQTIDPVTGDRLDQMKPGMIQRLGLGESVTFGDPRQQIGVGDYLRMQWLSIAFGVGMPYSMATGDLSNANYGSQRAGLLDFWILLDHWQWNMLIPMAYERAWRRVHQAFARLGQGPSEIPDAAYSPPKREWIDPEKDGRATVLKLRAGLMTWPQAIQETGEDPEEQFQTFMEWKPKVDEAGFDFSAAGASNQAPGPDPANPDQPPTDQPPPAGRLFNQKEMTRLANATTALTRALAAQATREIPAPVVNVQAPIVNLSPSIAVQERVDGSRELIVERDADNRIKRVRTEPISKGPISKAPTRRGAK